MKIVVWFAFVFGIYINAAVAFHFTAPKNWLKENTFKGVKEAWSLGDKNAATITIQSKTAKNNFNFSNIRPQQLVDFLVKTRKMSHEILGINNFKVDNFSLTKEGLIHTLKLKGSYSNIGGDVVKFEEWQFYKKNEYVQFSLSVPTRNKSFSLEKFKAIINRFRAFEK